MPSIPPMMELMIFLIVLQISLNIVLTEVFRLFQVVFQMVFMLPRAVDILFFTLVMMVFITVNIALKTVCTRLLIPFSMVENIPPIVESTVPIMPAMVPSTVLMIPAMASNTPCTMSIIASHAPCQSPVNTDTTKSIIPLITSIRPPMSWAMPAATLITVLYMSSMIGNTTGPTFVTIHSIRGTSTPFQNTLMASATLPNSSNIFCNTGSTATMSSSNFSPICCNTGCTFVFQNSSTTAVISLSPEASESNNGAKCSS